MKEYDVDKYFSNKALNKKQNDNFGNNENANDDKAVKEIVNKDKIKKEEKDIEINEMQKLHRMHEEE